MLHFRIRIGFESDSNPISNRFDESDFESDSGFEGSDSGFEIENVAWVLGRTSVVLRSVYLS